MQEQGVHRPRAATRRMGSYLNEHLAGATAGIALAQRLARSAALSGSAGPLTGLARDVAEDRASLIGIMQDLGIPVQRGRMAAGWAGEKASRLKVTGPLGHRSPLNIVFELETLRLGVEGKASMWRALRQLTEHYPDALDARLLDDLLERARDQAARLESLRAQQTVRAFTES